MAQDTKTADKQNTKPTAKKSVIKKILIGSLGILLTVGASVGATLFLTGSLPKLGHQEAEVSPHPPDSSPSPPKTNTPAQYLPLDPSFIVNFEDQGVLRYLQIGVTVMSRDTAVIEAVANNMPPIRNNLIMLFASQSYANLGSTEGKEKLRNQALEAIQSILHKEIGRPGIEAIYFTNFVMQ
jgi:flagellar FliL protein